MKMFLGKDGYQRFIREELAVLMRSLLRSPLYAVFGSYNKMGILQNGQMLTNYPDLMIQIVLDHGNYDHLRSHLALIRESGHLPVAQGVRPLLCIYAGYNGFDLAVETARNFREKNPDAIIIGTACTCVRDVDKNSDLPFDYFVQSDQCGMRWEIAELAEEMIRLWGEPKAPATAT